MVSEIVKNVVRKLTAIVSKWDMLVPLVLIVSATSTLSFAQPLFEDDTPSVGGPFHVGETWGASWGDLNGDLYPDLFTSNHGALNSVIRNNGDGTFTDIVNQVDAERIWTGAPNSDIHGGSWADFDNDGDQDLFVTRSSSGARFHVMENSGLGGFTEKGGPLGVGSTGGGRLPILFDYNNDGNLDIAVASTFENGLVLFKWNAPTNRFVRQTREAGVFNQCLTNNAGMATDLFNTGTLNYICLNEGAVPERVYDTSTLPFTDVSDKVESVGTNTDAVLADFNNDSLMDMVVNRGRVRPAGAKRVSSSRIEAWFTVSGTVNFEDSMTFSATGPILVNIYARNVGRPGGLRIGSSGNNATSLPVVLDPDDSSNHGLLELRDKRAVYIGYDETNEEWTIILSGGGRGQGEGAYIVVDGVDLSEPATTGFTGGDLPQVPQFLINNGRRLINRGARGISKIQCGGIAAADFDNDMDVDIYMACRDSISNFANRLYLNDGSGQFSLAEDHGAEGIVGSGIESQTGTSGMAITADYNVDGFMDVFVTNGNRLFPLLSKDGFSGGGPGQFFRNLANNGNHWLEIDLQGVTSNRDGYGAKVFVTAGGVTQYREQNGQYHRWSQDSKRLHFGLGTNTSANVTIEWPDGTSDDFTGVASDQLYLAVQGGDLTQRTPTLNSPSISISSDTVDEGETASVAVSLFPPSANAVTVDYQTVEDSADSSLDYAPVSGSLSFAPFETEKIVTIPVLPDIENEEQERFSVILSNPVNAILNQPQSVIIIKDDDDADIDGPVISISDTAIFEGDPAEFTISISEPPAQTVIVNFKTIEGSATEGQDYEPRFGQVRFEPSGPLSIIRKVTTYQEAGFEDTESFGLKLSNTQNANILSSTGTATLFDRDSVILDISINNASVIEGSEAALTVTLSETSTVPVSVDFSSSDILARAGIDYVPVSGSLEFAPGELSKTIVLTTLRNIDPDDNQKTLNINLSNAKNGVLADDVGLVTILSVDSPANKFIIPPILDLLLDGF